MAQNSEQIEAKLCAYIDGELDAAGRAEIEKYLQGNPQHRKLMLALAEQRQVLGSLPRESAPPDILEAVQGQLERAVLLDGDDDVAAGTTLRMTIWPKLTAIAALLLLAVGLAAVVIYVMPPMGTSPGSYAIHQREAEETDSPRREPQPLAQRETALAEAPADAHVEREMPVEATTEPPSARADAMADADLGHRDVILRDGAPTEPIDLSPYITRGGTAYDGPPIAPPSVVSPGIGYWSQLLGTEDVFAPPAFAESGRSEDPLADLLDRGALGMPGPEDAFAVVPEDRFALRRFEDGEDHLGGALFMVIETDDPARTNVELAHFFTRNQIAWSEVSEPMPPPLQLKQQQVVTMSRLQRVEGRLRAAEPQTVEEMDEVGTREGVEGQAEQFRAAEAADAPARLPLMKPQRPEAQDLAADALATENLIIARGMSIRQAEELQRSLYQPQARQRAQVIDHQVDANQLHQPRREVAAERQRRSSPAPAAEPPLAEDFMFAEPQAGPAAPATVPADEPGDLPHELPIEFDAAEPTDQVDVYVIILQNAAPVDAPGGQREAERTEEVEADSATEDEPASPSSEEPPPAAEPVGPAD